MAPARPLDSSPVMGRMPAGRRVDAQGPLERVLALEGAGIDEAAAYATALRALAAALRDPDTRGEVSNRMTAWLLPAIGLQPGAVHGDARWVEALWDAAVDALADPDALATYLETAASRLGARRPAHLNLLAMLRTRIGWRAKDKLRRRDRYQRRFGGVYLPEARPGSADERGRRVAALAVDKVRVAFADETEAMPVLEGLLEGGTISEVSRDTGMSRQRIYRLLGRMRAWIEGER